MLTATLLIGAALWLPGLWSRRVAAQTLNLSGPYGFSLTQVPSSGETPTGMTGVLSFDGNGNLVGNATNVLVGTDPNQTTVKVQPFQFFGTYVINTDGTGVLTAPTGGDGQASQTIAFVIIDSGSALMLLPTGGFGNRLLTGTARKQ